MSKSCYIGVDVSKDKLDICELTNKENQKPKYSSIPNKPEFINVYFEKFINSDVVVVFEATSNYHLNLQICLNSLKIRYSVLNPNKSSLFLKHLNTIKTDMTDSYGLAVYCKTFKSSILPSKYNKEYVLIKAYNSSYDLLSKMQSQLKNLIHSQNFIQDEDLKQTLINLQSAIELTKDKLQKIAFNLTKLLVPDTEKIIKESKGIGINLAVKLFPLMHFSRDKTDKQINSFIGLAPRVFESGSSVKKSNSINKKGDPSIRKALFMSALCCVRTNEVFKARFERLVLSGKPKMKALVAVMYAIIRYLKIYFRFEPERNFI